MNVVDSQQQTLGLVQLNLTCEHCGRSDVNVVSKSNLLLQDVHTTPYGN